MDQKRLIFAAFLSLAVLFGWSFLQERLFPAPKRAASTPPASTAASEPTAQAPSASPESAALTDADPSAPPREAVEAAAEQRVEVDTGPGHAVFTNRGAQLLSYRRQGRHRQGRPAARDGPRARRRSVPVRADRSDRRPARGQRRTVRGRGAGAGAWRERHRPGGAVPLQRRGGCGDQGVPVPEQWAARGGDPSRRARSVGRPDGAGPAQSGPDGARELAVGPQRVLSGRRRARDPAGSQATRGSAGAGRRLALGGPRGHLLPLDDRAQGAGHRSGDAAVPDDARGRRRPAGLEAAAAA